MKKSMKKKHLNIIVFICSIFYIFIYFNKIDTHNQVIQFYMEALLIYLRIIVIGLLLIRMVISYQIKKNKLDHQRIIKNCRNASLLARVFTLIGALVTILGFLGVNGDNGILNMDYLYYGAIFIQSGIIMFLLMINYKCYIKD